MRKLRLFFSVFGEFQVPPIGLEYELKHVEPFTMDPFGHKYSWNDAKEGGYIIERHIHQYKVSAEALISTRCLHAPFIFFSHIYNAF